MTYIIGLTGGIGSGKTAVSDYFSTLGITVVDADVCARIVVEPGKPALQAIVEHFGSTVLSSDGSLDRAQLRQIIFANEAERQWLETLLHPLIFEEMWGQLQNAKSPYAILVSPLLVEAGQAIICQRILVVDVPEDIQLARAAARDTNSTEQIKAIMSTQTSREMRAAAADDLLLNDSDLPALYKKIDALHQQYLHAASVKNQ